MSKLEHSLLEQWQKIYTKRTLKTGVSEKLRQFDIDFRAALGGTKFSASIKNPLMKEAGAGVVKTLRQELGKTVEKGPKVGKWTPAEQTFLHSLLDDLKSAHDVLSK